LPPLFEESKNGAKLHPYRGELPTPIKGLTLGITERINASGDQAPSCEKVKDSPKRIGV